MRALEPVLLLSEKNVSMGPRWDCCHWFALYTNSRHEKWVDQELKKKKIETFLPLRIVTRHWSDRKKVVLEPLFKSYIFVFSSLRRRWDILNTKGVVRFVGPSAADPLKVPERELAAVRQFMDEKIQVDPFPYLKVGEPVYIRTGPFKGVEGFIVRKGRDSRLVISFDVLMQSVSIVIDEACVEPR